MITINIHNSIHDALLRCQPKYKKEIIKTKENIKADEKNKNK